MPYCAKTRSDPEAIPLTEATLKGSSDEIEHSKKNDFLWLICRLNISDSLFHIIQEAQSIPRWTCFDAILCESSIPRKSVVGYCPTIDASSTEFFLYTLLVRSTKMADQIGQHDVPVVFDQAVYAKALEVKEVKSWSSRKTNGSISHCFALLAMIGKRFGDAGPEDIIIESEIIGNGSVNGGSPWLTL